jgi:hypothetical protein
MIKLLSPGGQTAATAMFRSNAGDGVGVPPRARRAKNMANANKKHFGAGSQGKADGSGSGTVEAKADIGPNAVLSNRDKKQHSKGRGQDSKHVQVEQLNDSESNQGGE